jgi:hypothetical protein
VSWQIRGGRVDGSWAKMSRWALVISVRWQKVSPGPVKAPDVDAVELAAELGPRVRLGCARGVVDSGPQEPA